MTHNELTESSHTEKETSWHVVKTQETEAEGVNSKKKSTLFIIVMLSGNAVRKSKPRGIRISIQAGSNSQTGGTHIRGRNRVLIFKWTCYNIYIVCRRYGKLSADGTVAVGVMRVARFNRVHSLLSIATNSEDKA